VILRAAAVAAAVLAFAGPAAAACGHPRTTLAHLEGQIMCPTCHTTLDQSDSPIAQRMKVFIARRIAAGDTRTQIENKLIATFGPSVVARPATHGFDLLAWLLPLAGIVAGAVLLGFAAWGWSRKRPPPSAGGPPLDPELERRVDEELARFES
jgi:cytochrome c-type biogenesis protein CcmH